MNNVSDPISELYGSRDNLVQYASRLTGNHDDAEDAVHNAFISIIAGSNTIPSKVEKRNPVLYQLVEDQCRKIVERREKRSAPSSGTVLNSDSV